MSEEFIVYNFATEYTRYPGGRLKKDGPYSGEAFREDILWPLIKSTKKIHINLSETFGFGSSFLDEAFGEVGKRMGFAACKEKIIFSSTDDPTIVEMIWAKILKATKN